jgi:hypothetical protein
MHKVKPLLAIPLAKYKLLWTKENGTEVLGYRTSTDLYLGKKNTLIATFDDDTFALHEFNLDKTITAAISDLSAFSSTQQNSKPQWKDKDKVDTKINRDILKTKELQSIVPYVIEETSSGINLTWEIDEHARAEALKDSGKSFIFTNQNKWSTFDIVKTYRAQIGVEDQFKTLNDREQISVMPMYHYTNQKIRAHVFISILALLISNLLYRKIKRHGIEGSMKKCFDLLDDIKIITLDYGDVNMRGTHVFYMPFLVSKKDKYGNEYLYIRHNHRVDGEVKLAYQVYLGAAKDLATRGKLLSLDFQTETIEFGLIAALLHIAKKIGLVGIINNATGKRDQGLSVGEHLLIAAVNRCVEPVSKTHLMEWLDSTVLRKIYPDLDVTPDSRAYWTHFQYVTEENVESIENELIRVIREVYKIDYTHLSFDPTNFFTYINPRKPNQELPKHGNSKEGRATLNIVNLSLFCTIDGGIPSFTWRTRETRLMPFTSSPPLLH